MDIVINPDSLTPIYRQITNQIAGDILQGKLKSNDILPSIRAIALDLKISVITTKRAYEELESMGLIYTVSGVGCFVSEITKSNVILLKNELLFERMKTDIDHYKSYGMRKDEIVEMFLKILNE